jgi:hypothetical protein
MNAVKGLGTAILCILLFISVGLISTATWLKATVLSQSFVNREVQNINITDLARNILNDQVNVDLPPEYAVAEPVVKDLLISVISVYEPWLKDQFDSITKQLYDYLQRRTDQLAVSIDLTQLKSTLRDNLWTIWTQKSATYLPQIVSGVEDYIVNNPADIVQYIPQDFLPPEARLLSQDQLAAYLEANKSLVRAQIDSLGTDAILAQLDNNVIEPYFNEFTDSAVTQIPDVYNVNTEVFGQDGLRQLADARRYLGYFETAYWALIAAALVLIGLVWLIWREVKHPARAVGITLAFFGVLELAGTIILRSINPFDYSNGLDMPTYARNILLNVYHDALQPMLVFNIVVLVVGVAVLVLSFFTKSGPREPGPEPIED